MRFSEIPGHDKVKDRLRRMVDSNQLPHALLLQGPRGTGKLMLARALVSYLHCTARTPDGDSCGRCPSCRQHDALNHVDTHYSFPTLKKKSDDPALSADYMEQWQEFLEEDPWADISNWLEKLDKPNGQPVIYRKEAEALATAMGYTTRTADYKVAIVWLPERFQPEAANKLLKLIEEPFPDTRMVFVSDTPGKILPTIYSRLQRVDVPKLDTDTMAEALVEEFRDLDLQQAADFATVADGDMIEARNMLTGSSNERMLRRFIMLMRLAFQRKIGDLKKWADDMAAEGREQQIKFLHYCCRLMRENFINNTGIADLTRLTAQEAEFSSKFSRFINSRNVLALIDEFEKAITDIAGNANAKIVFFDLSIHVILLIKDR